MQTCQRKLYMCNHYYYYYDRRMALAHLNNDKTNNHLWILNRQITQDKLDDAINRVLEAKKSIRKRNKT
jgi:hypothetical protein